MAFAEVWVWYHIGGVWSAPIPGIGGNMLIDKNKNGLQNSDEGYKMAITDALSVCFKAIGVAADIYMGNWDGSKYRDVKAEKTVAGPPAAGKTNGNGQDQKAVEAAVVQAVKDARAQIAKAITDKGYAVEQAPNLCGHDIEVLKKAKTVEEVKAALKAALETIGKAPEAQPA